MNNKEMDLDEMPDLYLPAGPSRSAEVDFASFWERIASISVLIRAQLAYRIATDDVFATRVFKAFSATARLRAIAALMSAESVEVH
jgi:hypothetical protein